MGEGSLSQDEIDALLMGVDDGSGGDSGSGGMDDFAPASAGSSSALSPVDASMLGDIVEKAFGIAGNTLGTILSKSVRFSNATVTSKSAINVANELGSDTVSLYTNLSGTANGRACLVVPVENAQGIINIMMGGAPTGALDNAQLQTLKDSLSPIVGTVIAQISSRLGGGIMGSPTEIKSVQAPPDLMLPEGDPLVTVQLSAAIDGMDSFKVNFIISAAVAGDILNLSRQGGAAPQVGGGGGGMVPQVSSEIKSVGLPSLSSVGAPSGVTNLELLMDVQMSVTVELGRTKMYIKDILSLGEGSIIELDKLAGEPVDLLVNGKLIAKGEVVVIDENFGVRVTDIVSPVDRIKPAK